MFLTDAVLPNRTTYTASVRLGLRRGIGEGAVRKRLVGGSRPGSRYPLQGHPPPAGDLPIQSTEFPALPAPGLFPDPAGRPSTTTVTGPTGDPEGWEGVRQRLLKIAHISVTRGA